MEKEQTSFLIYFGMLFFILGMNLFATAFTPNTTWITIWATLLTVVGIVIIREGLRRK